MIADLPDSTLKKAWLMKILSDVIIQSIKNAKAKGCHGHHLTIRYLLEADLDDNIFLAAMLDHKLIDALHCLIFAAKKTTFAVTLMTKNYENKLGQIINEKKKKTQEKFFKEMGKNQ